MVGAPSTSHDDEALGSRCFVAEADTREVPSPTPSTPRQAQTGRLGSAFSTSHRDEEGAALHRNQQEAGMPDDKTKAGGADRRRISLTEDFEVRDWSQKYGVTPQELRDAVAAVGDQAAAVEARLKGKQR